VNRSSSFQMCLRSIATTACYLITLVVSSWW
jgi:hypothetical protein